MCRLSEVLLYMCIWATSSQNQQCGCAPSEDSDQPGHPPRCPGWSESSLSAWRKLGSLADAWLIWVFAGRTLTLLVLSWGGSYVFSIGFAASHHILFFTPNSKELTLFLCLCVFTVLQLLRSSYSCRGLRKLLPCLIIRRLLVSVKLQ